ncbi:MULTISPECIES: succinyl-diaminopimelate desuccinylase [Thermomonospora]|uniref:Succinyl-diaminopimelate desuccinylase n=1 Tax=Thermomonospora curvata (strain ATCC 19995 / DSM 43183 / JCM 3096 / KCTC 9072 / NBRC 15933 / NCIMB 10081 / Henssen B9) TaxID=471852 RepID=D1A8R0_THECD|nr:MULTISPECIES: succinyl-diaminopimelate desuccinylase [Thermomonospora]ACY96755.1 succinyl-diaminopimelate desuccinylase [Thermomonospora curvata DSM 43183]PKK15301.1 MAG: succinyl-diaminopimelate desuccinylase [Thermomonospora sp. CIF 1]
MRLDLGADVAELTAAIVDIESVSGREKALADAVEEALRPLPHLRVERDGDAVIARTALGRAERVVIAGHLDTVPVNGNLPSRVVGDRLYGCGTSDMKSGLAVMLKLAATVPEPTRDVTYLFYECEEVEAVRNGLARLAASRPELLAGDFAVLMEPTAAVIEGGCQGTIRVEVTARGARAHSARAWMGVNAIHKAGEILDVLRSYRPRKPVVDGLEYHEGLNAVFVRGGVAGNVIPDECTVTVNYRFAPDRTLADAEAHLRELFEGFEVTVVDAAESARPGLAHPAAAAFVAAVGGTPRAKLGWTDVARFSALGVPAVNYGPGDPPLSHTKDEYVEIPLIRDCERRMRAWLTAG